MSEVDKLTTDVKELKVIGDVNPPKPPPTVDEKAQAASLELALSDRHIEGNICMKDCEYCNVKSYRLYWNYFHVLYRKRLLETFGNAVCRKGWNMDVHEASPPFLGPEDPPACRVCKYLNWRDARCICGHPTGKQLVGLACFRAVQIHTEHCQGDERMLACRGCGCVLHMQPVLMCSVECVEGNGQWYEAAQQNKTKLTDVKLDTKTGRRYFNSLTIPERGPLLIVHHEKARSDAASYGYVDNEYTDQATKPALRCLRCDKKPEKPLYCSKCSSRSMAYCGADCFREDWKRHRMQCKKKQ